MRGSASHPGSQSAESPRQNCLTPSRPPRCHLHLLTSPSSTQHLIEQAPRPPARRGQRSRADNPRPRRGACHPARPPIFRLKKQVSDLPEGLRPAFNRPATSRKVAKEVRDPSSDLPPYRGTCLQPGTPTSRHLDKLLCTQATDVPEGHPTGPRPLERPRGRSPTSARRRSETSQNLAAPDRPDPPEPQRRNQLGSTFFGSALGSATTAGAVAPAGADRCAAATASRWFTIGSSATRAASAVAGSSCSIDPITLLA